MFWSFKSHLWLWISTRKGTIGVKLHSGSTTTRKSVNLTQSMTQSWVNVTPLFIKSAESWRNPGSLLTRNWVWPQWTLFWVTLTRVFLKCRLHCCINMFAGVLQCIYYIPVYVSFRMFEISNASIWMSIYSVSHKKGNPDLIQISEKQKDGSQN